GLREARAQRSRVAGEELFEHFRWIHGFGRDAVCLGPKRPSDDVGNRNAAPAQACNEPCVFGAEAHVHELHPANVKTDCLYVKAAASWAARSRPREGVER